MYMAVLYIHKRIADDSVFYVGIGKSKKRAYSKKTRNPHWHSIASKGYKVEILFENLSWDEAKLMESKLIQQYGRRDLGLGMLVNMTDGGDGLGVVSDDVRHKMSTSWKPHSAEVAQKRLEALRKVVTGKPRSNETKMKISKGNKGKSRTEEYKAAVSERMKGKTPWNKGKKLPPLSDEHKRALLQANRCRACSDETKSKISNANKGRVSFRKGIPLSEEHKRKISEARRRNKAADNQPVI